MSLTLSLRGNLGVPLEAECISADQLAGLSVTDVEALPVLSGNRTACVGDFFKVVGEKDGEVRVEGDLRRVKMIGAGMSTGRIVVDGNVGQHLGMGMVGGEIVINGDAGDWLGPEMSGGRITVKGNAGHMVGSAYRGSRIGMRGGEIVVLGNAGNEIGNAMRNGLIAVGGNGGDFAGVNMLAGTIVIFGRSGDRPGAGMRRGSIAIMEQTALLPTFMFSCAYRPVYLRLYLLYLRQLGLPVSDAQIAARYRRWCGDSVFLNRGEVLVLDR
jgi:formylmethanofuran dehydrogenase subunit C